MDSYTNYIDAVYLFAGMKTQNITFLAQNNMAQSVDDITNILEYAMTKHQTYSDG